MPDSSQNVHEKEEGKDKKGKADESGVGAGKKGRKRTKRSKREQKRKALDSIKERVVVEIRPSPKKQSNSFVNYRRELKETVGTLLTHYKVFGNPIFKIENRKR